MYDPGRLLDDILKCGHGKATINALRSAIEQADSNNDVPYMVYFRHLLCYESDDYGDKLDIVTVYPELLAIIDRHPVIENVPCMGSGDEVIEHVLWTYETLMEVCGCFYQIPMEDCLEFVNDFKRRWLALGHGERECDRMIVELYLDFGDMDNAEKFLSSMKKSAFNSYDCPGCCANTEIKYYLRNNEKEKADKLAKKIEDYSLLCRGNSRERALMRMKENYLTYYILHGDYEKAADIAYMMERSYLDEKEFKPWESFMCAYVHSKPGRGLRIYKRHWKEWQEERSMFSRYENFKCSACFFKGLQAEREGDSIKLWADNSFPLYSEDNIYNIEELSRYYYKEAEDIAKKFDKRNGTGRFIKQLEEAFANV